jgi:hypothetical protein
MDFFVIRSSPNINTEPLRGKPETAQKYYFPELAFNSVNGALSCAGTAVDASTFVDNINAAIFLDSVNGALSCARTATDALSTDFVSH